VCSPGVTARDWAAPENMTWWCDPPRDWAAPENMTWWCRKMRAAHFSTPPCLFGARRRRAQHTEMKRYLIHFLEKDEPALEKAETFYG